MLGQIILPWIGYDHLNTTQITQQVNEVKRRNQKLGLLNNRLQRARRHLEEYKNKEYASDTLNLYNYRNPLLHALMNTSFKLVQLYPDLWYMPQTRRDYLAELTDACLKLNVGAFTIKDRVSKESNATSVSSVKNRQRRRYRNGSGLASLQHKITDIKTDNRHEIYQLIDKLTDVCQKDAKIVRSELGVPIAGAFFGLTTGAAVASHSVIQNMQSKEAVSSISNVNEVLFGDTDLQKMEALLLQTNGLQDKLLLDMDFEKLVPEVSNFANMMNEYGKTRTDAEQKAIAKFYELIR